MIPLAANIPLTLCSVVIRRFIDSYTGRLPLVVASGTIPTASTVALFSGALVCLYHQLRKGTLVRVGLGKNISSFIRNSRHTIQRRVKNNSWFLRNINSCRRKCAEAMFKLAQPSDDSLAQLQAETGMVDAAKIAETTSLPVFRRRFSVDAKRTAKQFNEPLLENLFSNESFDCNDNSTQDIGVNVKSEEPRRRRRRSVLHVSPTRRPVTRNFRKKVEEEEGSCGDGRRLPSKKRKKPDVLPMLDESDDEILEVENKLNNSPWGTSVQPEQSPLKVVNRRHSERLKKQPKVQKITRKTRSGRVYAYRL